MSISLKFALQCVVLLNLTLIPTISLCQEGPIDYVAPEQLLSDPSAVTLPPYRISIIVDFARDRSLGADLSIGDKANLMVRVHSKPSEGTNGTNRDIELTSPVVVTGIQDWANRTEFELAVSEEQANEIADAHIVSPYWFSLISFKPGHAEAFAKAPDVKQFLGENPSMVPCMETEWGYGARGRRIVAPTRESLSSCGVVFRAGNSPIDTLSNGVGISSDLSNRRSVEAAYGSLEVASLQAARDYRAEAAQETSDPNVLAELKEKLAATVKAAFEAQVNLQRVRIQIAQQDLAEVAAKHQRRQSLAAKIIERRIEDLINGDDLEWATRKKEPSATFSKKTSASRGPISDAVKDRATVQEFVDDWSTRTRALGDNAMEQRDAALSEIATALKSDDVIQLQAATTALAHLGDVKCDKPQCRPRLLELVRSDDGDIQTMAFHALFNTARREGDLKLLQDVLSESHSVLLEYSALQLLLMFGDGVIDSASEEIVLNLLNSPDSTVRRQTLKGLFGIKASDRLTARVIELVDDKESRDDAIDCVLALSSEKNAAVIDKLIEVLSDSEWKNRDRALNGLRYGVPESQQAKVAAALLQMYESRSDFDTHRRCAELIQIHGDSSQRETLARFQKSSEKPSE